MERKPFLSTLYVAISRPDGSDPFVQVMFHSDGRSNFRRYGISFSRMNGTLAICGVGGPKGYAGLEAYDDRVEVENARGERFRVAVFPTESRANAFLSTDSSADTPSTTP